MISPRRIGLVAAREFVVTVSSKGFLIGVLAMPLILVAFIWLLPKMIARQDVRMDVEVALIDRSGTVAESLRTELDPATIRARREAQRRAVAEQLGPVADQAAGRGAAGTIPRFTLRELPADATAEGQSGWLADPGIGRQQRRALVVVPAGAVTQPVDGIYQTYQLRAPRNLPEDEEEVLHAALRQALVAERLRAAGVDPALVRAAGQVPRPRTQVVFADGRQQGGQGLNRMLPFIMGILLFMGVVMGGQSLMASTVEEKGSRVIEVLLAAVSPLELMWGKLLGQLGVSFVTMAVYVGLGVLALLQFALLGLIDPMLLLWLFLFFVTAYLVYGALMQAIGAAVNQLADAQSLLMPVMLLLIIPYIFTPIIGRQPDSALALTMSFIPPVNAFAMLARLASSSPPPVWQVLASLVASLAGAAIAVWFAAKVFRVGLLMHGKPPGFATLVKWARMS